MVARGPTSLDKYLDRSVPSDQFYNIFAVFILRLQDWSNV